VRSNPDVSRQLTPRCAHIAPELGPKGIAVLLISWASGLIPWSFQPDPLPSCPRRSDGDLIRNSSMLLVSPASWLSLMRSEASDVGRTRPCAAPIWGRCANATCVTRVQPTVVRQTKRRNGKPLCRVVFRRRLTLTVQGRRRDVVRHQINSNP
jgi:hypothetical protein